MKAFVDLFNTVDQTTKTSVKRAALRDYFRTIDPRDGAWSLKILTGGRLKRVVKHNTLMRAAEQASGLPEWLIARCFSMTGDRGEALALVLPDVYPSADEETATAPAGLITPPLHQLIENHLLPMRQMTEPEQITALIDSWQLLTSVTERFIFHKLLSGTFRFGAAKKLVTQAFADAAGVDSAVMEHRLLSQWEATPEAYAGFMQAETATDHARPYPFYLASPVDEASMATAAQIQTLCGPVHDWQLEPKYDGIRCQLLRRGDIYLCWSRGQELINDAFPELVALCQALPDGCALDGELLAWPPEEPPETPPETPPEGLRETVPLPFSDLQKRLNRKNVQPMLFADVPVAFAAYDLLELDGKDLRQTPLTERRAQLETLAAAVDDPTLRLAPLIPAQDWSQAAAYVQSARQRGVEGLMVKRKTSVYGTGRTRGDWWKWKVDPFTLDCVMVYAQRGSGRRASLYTDFTFAVWKEAPAGDTSEEDSGWPSGGPSGGGGGGELVTITKAYSGLTDKQFDQIDAWIRKNTLSTRGAFRAVKPEHVFEIAFEGIQPSNRHKSGYALRFPRMKRWRTDKPPEEADTLQTVERLYKNALSEPPTVARGDA